MESVQCQTLQAAQPNVSPLWRRAMWLVISFLGTRPGLGHSGQETRSDRSTSGSHRGQDRSLILNTYLLVGDGDGNLSLKILENTNQL